jgi:alkane 1-monooxygenase
MTTASTGSQGAADAARPAWRDGKRYAWMLGVLVPSLPFIVCGLVQLTGSPVFWFWGPILIFGLFPPLDLVIGLDAENPPDSVLKWLEQDRYYRWCTYAFLPLQYAGLVFACALWASGDLTVLDKVGLALTEAMVSGIAINTAHELGHKRDRHERWLSKIALAQSGYGHFFVEHNRGHHVRVATPKDRAVRGADRGVRPRRAALPADPDDRWLPAARGGQLPGALRAAPPEASRRPV